MYQHAQLHPNFYSHFSLTHSFTYSSTWFSFDWSFIHSFYFYKIMGYIMTFLYFVHVYNVLQSHLPPSFFLLSTPLTRQYWSLNLGLCACKAGTLLEPYL
jgi:hypothetical protein